MSFSLLPTDGALRFPESYELISGAIYQHLDILVLKSIFFKKNVKDSEEIVKIFY